jgi:hypothetical protein
MGGGRWDSTTYHSTRTDRASKGVADFAYTAVADKTQQVHENLDPKRISKKPFQKLESRDSVEHPESNAVLVCFDVTGSNKTRAIDAQAKLPALMEMLNKYLSDPQVAIACNDDYLVTRTNSVQISDFESDIRIDEHIRNAWLVGNGGGNNMESYDLLLFAAARKTIIDCFEVRGKKGYLFMYADERFYPMVRAAEVNDVFGDSLEADISIEKIIDEVKEKYNVYILWPQGGYVDAREQHVQLFGESNVITLQHPNQICELIASVICLNEKKATSEEVVNDLVLMGISDSEAKSLVTSATSVTPVKSDWKGGKGAGAARL